MESASDNVAWLDTHTRALSMESTVTVATPTLAMDLQCVAFLALETAPRHVETTLPTAYTPFARQVSLVWTAYRSVVTAVDRTIIVTPARECACLAARRAGPVQCAPSGGNRI